MLIHTTCKVEITLQSSWRGVGSMKKRSIEDRREPVRGKDSIYDGVKVCGERMYGSKWV